MRPKYTLIWFILGAAIPRAAGAALMIQVQLSLPTLQPGVAHCDTGALTPVCLILFGTPIGGICGRVGGNLLRD